MKHPRTSRQTEQSTRRKRLMNSRTKSIRYIRSPKKTSEAAFDLYASSGMTLKIDS